MRLGRGDAGAHQAARGLKLADGGAGALAVDAVDAVLREIAQLGQPALNQQHLPCAVADAQRNAHRLVVLKRGHDLREDVRLRGGHGVVLVAEELVERDHLVSLIGGEFHKRDQLAHVLLRGVEQVDVARLERGHQVLERRGRRGDRPCDDRVVAQLLEVGVRARVARAGAAVHAEEVHVVVQPEHIVDGDVGRPDLDRQLGFGQPVELAVAPRPVFDLKAQILHARADDVVHAVLHDRLPQREQRQLRAVVLRRRERVAEVGLVGAFIQRDGDHVLVGLAAGIDGQEVIRRLGRPGRGRRAGLGRWLRAGRGRGGVQTQRRGRCGIRAGLSEGQHGILAMLGNPGLDGDGGAQRRRTDHQRRNQKGIDAPASAGLLFGHGHTSHSDSINNFSIAFF